MKYNIFFSFKVLAFSESNQQIGGFRIFRKSYIVNQHINIVDKFIILDTKIQRFIEISIVR